MNKLYFVAVLLGSSLLFQSNTTAAPTISLAGDQDNFGTNTTPGSSIRLIDIAHEADDGDFDKGLPFWCGQYQFKGYVCVKR